MSYSRQVQFYETDMMGVVHHSNYLRFFEESRLDWMFEKDLMKEHAPHTDITFAVVDAGCRYRQTCRFGDQFHIEMQVKKEGRARIKFEYALFVGKTLCCTGHTLHIAVDSTFRVCKIPDKVSKILEKEVWTETWLSNL